MNFVSIEDIVLFKLFVMKNLVFLSVQTAWKNALLHNKVIILLLVIVNLCINEIYSASFKNWFSLKTTQNFMKNSL